MAERIYSEGLRLPDGRKVRVLAYDDGSIRFRVDGTPYVLEEAFLQGSKNDHAILKIAPRVSAGIDMNGNAPDKTSPETLLGLLDTLREGIKQNLTIGSREIPEE